MTRSEFDQQIRELKNKKGNAIRENLLLTIDNYAAALELRDTYREQVIKKPTVYEQGSMKQLVTKQNPLCNLLYQQEALCQNYAKMLGLTAAKAATKTEDPSKTNNTNLDEFIDGING